MKEAFMRADNHDGPGAGAAGRCLPCEVTRENAAVVGFSDWVTRLVHAHRAYLARVARAEGLLAEDAFDAVQEAFRAFVARPDAPQLVTAPDDARRLLTVLTHNVARNRRRLHAGARPHTSDADVVEALPDASPTSEQLLEALEQQQQLARCVGELAEAQRAVVTLRMLDEVPGEDVARMLGIAPGHVAVLLHRAKANLATCMAAADPSSAPAPALVTDISQESPTELTKGSLS
jgi:RNA polymerase sigma-70 factor, ECF subfamily